MRLFACLFSFFSLVFGFFSVGCNQKIPLQSARIHFDKQNPDDYSGISYHDRFGDGQNIKFENRRLDTVIRDYLPATILLIGKGRITANYLKPNDNFIISANKKGQLVEKSENTCTALFEFNEEKLSAPVFESELNWDNNYFNPDKDGFHRNHFGYERMKGRKIALDKALSNLQKLDDTCRLPLDDKKRFQSQLNDWFAGYIVSDAINAQPDSLTEPHVAEILKTLNKKILTLYDAKKGLHFNEQRLVYSYNVFLSRDARNTPDELKTQWNNAARFNIQGRDFIRLRLLKKYLYRYAPDYDKYFTEFKKTAQDKDFIAYADEFKKSYRTALNAEELANEMRDTAGNRFTLQQIMDNNKGKLIYLVIWNVWGVNFTWGEKQEQINVLNRAKELNAVPVFLSANKELKLWKMAVDSTPLGNNPTYNIEVASPLFKYLDQGFAFHNLIIKNGKVLEYFAPSPENKEILLKTLERIAADK